MIARLRFLAGLITFALTITTKEQAS